jgi:hypothetical protein
MARNQSDIDLLASVFVEDDPEPEQKPNSAVVEIGPSGFEPDLNRVQLKIFREDTEIILGFGEKGSGKSIGFLHKIVKHCYLEWNALAMMVSPSIRTGQEGIGQDLDTLVLPHWAERMGLEYKPGKMDPSTKDRVWWIGNRYGYWSKIMLISIPYTEAVQARVKGPAPSFIYIDELTNCPSREYFTYTHAQLNRRRDITILRGMFATARIGKTGSSTVAFPAGQQIDVNYVETGSPANSGMTIAL